MDHYLTIKLPWWSILSQIRVILFSLKLNEYGFGLDKKAYDNFLGLPNKSVRQKTEATVINIYVINRSFLFGIVADLPGNKYI